MGFWIELLIFQRQRRYPICKPCECPLRVGITGGGSFEISLFQ